MNIALKNYRKIHKNSRAVNDWTYYGSTGYVRRATCIYCREIITTCSNKWPETKTFQREVDKHECQMKKYYLFISSKEAFNLFMDPK